jgi:hypothetical protein
MKYLEQKDPPLHLKVKSIIKNCAERNRNKEPGYESVTGTFRDCQLFSTEEFELLHLPCRLCVYEHECFRFQWNYCVDLQINRFFEFQRLCACS